MTIGRLIASRDPAAVVTCDAEARLGDAVDCLAAHGIGAVPVMRHGQVAGILSERDVIHRLHEEGAGCLDRQVSEIMTAPAITVERATKVADALQLMTEQRVRHLPVVEHGRMLGFVSIGDLVKDRIDEATRDAEALRQYITTA